MTYTVHQLAKISGVSGRTLRYYDHIDLLKPATINASGYRIYGENEVNLLQQILFFREMDLRLEEIKKMIHDPNFNRIEALKKHYQSLEQKRARLDQLMNTVQNTINHAEEETFMQDEAKFVGFKEKMIDENEQKYGKEIREKYGEETIDSSNAKLRGMTQKAYQAMKDVEESLFISLEKALETGDPASEKAQQVAEKHKEWLMYSWTTYSKEAHAGLAEMYVADERFTAYYDDRVKGGAAFLSDAILVFTNMDET